MKLDKILHGILMVGSVGSMILYTLGILLTTLLSGSSDIGFVLETSAILNVSEGFTPFTLLFLGTILLIITPVVLAIASSLFFAVKGQYTFMILSALVLIIISVSTILGLTGLLTLQR